MAFTFTAEDGTGIAGANAYADVAFVDDYHSGRGNAAWTGATSVKQAAIVKATDYLEQRFAGRFLGTHGTGGLHWPALNAYLDGIKITIVPVEVKQACAEYALRALGTASLAPDIVGGGIVSESIDGGGISDSVTYASPGQIPRYPAADRWLSRLIYGTEISRA